MPVDKDDAYPSDRFADVKLAKEIKAILHPEGYDVLYPETEDELGNPKIAQILQLIHAREEAAKVSVVGWLEADLKRLDGRNWTMETMALDHLVGSGRADDYQKDKRQQIVEDRRAAHALYAILNNYKQQVFQSQLKENKEKL